MTSGSSENVKCPQCSLINLATDSSCRRCGAYLPLSSVAADLYDPTPRDSRGLLRWMLWIAGVAWVIVFIWSRSLVFTSEALDTDRRWQVNTAIDVLQQAGFSREAFVLKNLTNYRATDSWWNAYLGHENAYASTNFPLEIVTLYPAFFTAPVDDTERAAILLHEAQHLLGANEEQALERTWREKGRIGWTRDRYGDTKVFQTTDEASFSGTNLFQCKENHHWDCVPPVMSHPGETIDANGRVVPDAD
jgi:hypothetical protein